MDQQPQTQIPTPPPNDDLQAMLRGGGGGRSTTFTLVLAAVALLAIGFIGGLIVGKHVESTRQVAAGIGSRPGFLGNGGNGGGLPGGGFPGGGSQGNNGGNGQANADITFGTIQSIDGDTITIRTQSGDTVTVKAGADTQVRVTKDGSVSDLSKGSTVVVAGTLNGSTVDATSISEGGGFPGGFGGTGQGGAGSSG